MAVAGVRPFCRLRHRANNRKTARRMLDFAAMNDLRLRFCDRSQPDLPLDAGMHALGRTAAGLGPVGIDMPSLLRLSNDRRGVWLTVTEGLRGVHVNGRPVQQVAMLRPGDSIHADGCELLLYAADGDRMPPPSLARDPAGNLRLALRGIGGPHHGRSLSLEKPRRIGSAADADLRIEGSGIAAEHALIEAAGSQAILRQASADVLVNGQPLRQAVLHSGDQIAFGVQHRFVLEGPPLAAPLPAPQAQPDADAPPSPPPRGWTQRVPWLLVTALLLAAALAALLVFGAR